MKYNKREIMMNAWSIRRSENVSMSIALQKAWSIAKNPSKTEFDGYAEIDGFTFNLWEKYGKRRIYINNYSGRNKSNTGGYINLDSDNSIVATGCVKDAARRFLEAYEIA